MIKILRSSERALRKNAWLESRHSFNCGGVDAEDENGFRALREINDDLLAPGAGFPMHRHKDMEIICFVLSGSMSHQDNYGHSSMLRASDVLRMSAGSGIEHAESNPSETESLRFLQIWLKPSRPGLKPSYEQMSFPKEERKGSFQLIVSGDRVEDALFVHQDVQIYACALEAGERICPQLGPNRHGWLQMATGAAVMNYKGLEEGDGAAISGEPRIDIECVRPCEMIFFNLG